MKFSTKSRYALRLMAELARYAPGTTVSLKEISERQNLSLKYLEQIVTPLARVGLVKSERGSQGGYRLTKAPADYTAGEILRAIEGSVAPIPCLGSQTNECPMSEQCFTLPFWAGLDEVIELKHTAYSRSVFGKGAVEAARFLAGKPAGMYDMSDVIQF